MERLISARTLVVLIVGTGWATAASADTITVCWDGSGDYLTIQEGIDAALGGDEVVVCDGFYYGADNRNLDFAGKAITVRSENGPQSCIISCDQAARGFHFHSGETGSSVVGGFTIRAAIPVGIRCELNSSPTIMGCIITETVNDAGIQCTSNSSPFITNCTITGNSSGSGIDCGASCDPMILNCLISDNHVGSSGHGGGIRCDASPMIVNCVIRQNSAGTGAGIYTYLGAPVIVNCTIVENIASSKSGGIHCYLSNPLIVNCTLSGNRAHDSAGGIYCNGDATIANCVLWHNYAFMHPELEEHSGSNLLVTYCDIEGGWPGEGNIDADPLFADPASHDFRLSPGSPCIDAGNNNAVPQDTLDLDGDGDIVELIPFDLDGNSRIVDDSGTPDTGNGTPPIIDMGAYEFQDTSPPPPCLGDLDGDGDVDLADLAALLAVYGTTCE